ncbi:uncharacterized protein BXZ73DRAFT_87094 [Epithele typhae]|uniref:uncharacterized protein n=1 Tax=Epithele typhae TaxID=378194 RepID=UPI0020074FDA|nr:uncharacterized protein BXZ73DRAFT_87094 [Epithele typhae]KAH9944133.1 hypothetical protein BXZ73DRAFT_87094 [Epithele typhae]
MAAPFPRAWSFFIWSSLFLAFLLLPAFAQNAPSLSLSLTTRTTTFTTTSSAARTTATITSTIATTFNVTVTQSSSSASTTSSAAPSATASAPPDFTKLDTHITPAFGVLGALLIITGIPSAFLGHKNRWTSFFLVGFYTLSLVCFVLILRFGVIQAINPPSATLQGLFVLSCAVAGIAGGAIAIFFWKAAKYFIGAWGGLALALWIQCFKDGGLIGPIGFRWIFYIGVAVVGFVLCTIPKLHYYVLLTSTAFVGATSFMLGVDCYTTAGLKEFYVWNIGFNTLFTKYTSHGIQFPVTQIMQIELGLMGAVSIMGMAVQFRILNMLMKKMKEIEEERKEQDQAAEARAAERFKDLDLEKSEWDRLHPMMLKHGRADSNISGQPLLGLDGIPSQDPDSPTGTPRQRYQSGVSEFMAAPTPTEELHRAAHRQLQTPGVLPTLDLGGNIENNVPDSFIAKNSESSGAVPRPPQFAAQGSKERETLLSEIHTIRRSIELLRTETPGLVSSSSSDGRRPSTSRPLSQDFSTLSATPHLRPPGSSMELGGLGRSNVGESIGRPTSAPLRDDWDTYVNERKLLQPPSGVSAPIATTPVSANPRPSPSPAVMEALKGRQHRESAMSFGGGLAASNNSSSEDLPLAQRPQHKKTKSQSSMPVTILPPKRPIAQPSPTKAADSGSPRVKTFEELVERHREKLRELQAPITQAQKEEADVSAARNRWERAKSAEKAAVEKRQAEREQAVRGKMQRTGSGSGEDSDAKAKHRRSLSADMLATIPGGGASSRRMSTMKVEDWQRQQQDSTDEPASQARPGHSRRGSTSASKRLSEVPFPDSRDRRRMSSAPRDPIS